MLLVGSYWRKISNLLFRLGLCYLPPSSYRVQNGVSFVWSSWYSEVRQLFNSRSYIQQLLRYIVNQFCFGNILNNSSPYFFFFKILLAATVHPWKYLQREKQTIQIFLLLRKSYDVPRLNFPSARPCAAALCLLLLCSVHHPNLTIRRTCKYTSSLLHIFMNPFSAEHCCFYTSPGDQRRIKQMELDCCCLEMLWALGPGVEDDDDGCPHNNFSFTKTTTKHSTWIGSDWAIIGEIPSSRKPAWNPAQIDAAFSKPNRTCLPAASTWEAKAFNSNGNPWKNNSQSSRTGCWLPHTKLCKARKMEINLLSQSEISSCLPFINGVGWLTGWNGIESLKMYFYLATYAWGRKDFLQFRRCRNRHKHNVCDFERCGNSSTGCEF